MPGLLSGNAKGPGLRQINLIALLCGTNPVVIGICKTSKISTILNSQAECTSLLDEGLSSTSVPP